MDHYDPNITKIDLHFGVENDPNLTLDPLSRGYKRIDGMAVTPGQYSYNLEDLGADLDYYTTYYWKVIGYEPNDMGGLDPVSGPVWSFRSINDQPEVGPVDPVFQAVDAGQNAVMSVTGLNVITYACIKSAMQIR